MLFRSAEHDGTIPLAKENETRCRCKTQRRGDVGCPTSRAVGSRWCDNVPVKPGQFRSLLADPSDVVVNAMKIKVRGAHALEETAAKLRRLAADAKQVDGARLTMAIRPDENGFIDRECPECRSQFKVGATELENHTASLVCPYDGHTAPKGRWTTAAHVEEAKQQTKALANAWFESSMKGANGRTASGLMNLARAPEGRRGGTLLPASALEILAQDRTCDQCGCRFAFIGAAFFCPMCGDNSANATFDQTILNMRRSIAALPKICNDLDPDLRAEVRRTLLEKHLQDTVTAFRRVGESLYQSATGTNAPVNAFQRLGGGADGDTLWQVAMGQSYEGYLEMHHRDGRAAQQMPADRR